MSSPTNRGTKTIVNDIGGTILENVIARDDQGLALGSAASPVAVNVATWIGSAAPTVGQKTMAASLPVAIASDQTGLSLGTATGKTVTMVSGTLVSVAVGLQDVLNFVGTAGKTFYLEYATIEGAFTVRPAIPATAGALLGLVTLESPVGTVLWSGRLADTNNGQPDRVVLTFPEPIPVMTGAIQIRWRANPAVATSITWIGNFGGYLR